MVSDAGPMDTDNEPPRAQTQLSQESKLVEEIQHVVTGQKATFCCGGSVAIITNSDEAKEHRFDDVAGLIASPPVVLRWDLPSGMYAPISCFLFPATHSLLTVSSVVQRMSYSPGKFEFNDHWFSQSKADE